MDTAKKLTRTSIALHWLVAIPILGLAALGIYMVQTESWHLYHTHKSIGLIAAGLILARLAWRLHHGLPPPVRDMAQLEHLASKIAHWLLLALSVAMPATGVMYSAYSGHGFGIFGVELFPAQYLDGQAVPLDAGLAALGQTLHGWTGYALLGVIALHVAAALKHHWVDKDGTLQRMVGARKVLHREGAAD